MKSIEPYHQRCAFWQNIAQFRIVIKYFSHFVDWPQLILRLQAYSTNSRVFIDRLDLIHGIPSPMLYNTKRIFLNFREEKLSEFTILNFKIKFRTQYAIISTHIRDRRDLTVKMSKCLWPYKMSERRVRSAVQCSNHWNWFVCLFVEPTHIAVCAALNDKSKHNNLY